MDVLQIATHNGAIALGIDDEVGTIAVGKRADLVVLRANPLEKMDHTRTVEGIILNGTMYRPDDLLEIP
jgi:imidazolonepropionase-like amidohydrolase